MRKRDAVGFKQPTRKSERGGVPIEVVVLLLIGVITSAVLLARPWSG
jgi:hypothetical protein